MMPNNARCTYRVLKEMILQLILHPLRKLRINAASKQKSACSLLFLLTNGSAKLTVLADLQLRRFFHCMFSVAVRHFTGAGGINQL